ncbi:hypothetical protein F5Y19DRAFT_484977 [Xylariaceae sp. FL1651]|nr:hypothetical protein F5Y19DRAFT_484977 [Xylariaceae sp. FL1651]
MSSSKVAIITGGASGIGLAVTEALSQKGWAVHIFDVNNEKGATAAANNPSVIFHEADITSWESLSRAFDAPFKAKGHLDFVFANAGVLEKRSSTRGTSSELTAATAMGAAEEEIWDKYPPEFLTPMSSITATVEMLLAGEHMQDASGKVVEDSNTGLAVEILGDETYF